MFDKATRLKLRFASTKGQLSVEQLWDLSLENLNTIAKDLNSQIKKAGDEEDFLHVAEKTDQLLQLRFDIVKHILTTKLDERNERNERQEKREQNAVIQAIIERKRAQELEDKPIEELEKMLIK